MAHSYKFAIIRVAPDDVRDERINVGLVVFRDEGLDLRFAARLQKVRAISGILSLADIEAAGVALEKIDQLASRHGGDAARYDAIKRVGPFALSVLGEFSARDSEAYEQRVASIIRSYVDSEVPARVQRTKRSRLFTIVKKVFRDERILAKKDEDLDSHRIVPGLEIDEGLVADLALKNGAMHVVETVDAGASTESFKRTVADFGVSSLVLGRARMKFGPKTSTQLVYSASVEMESHVGPSLAAIENQGVKIFNWASDSDQLAFVSGLAQLAHPYEVASRRKFRPRLTS
jgi:hypothetical protein